MPPHLSAILWAQWRTLRNFYPRNARGGLILTLIVSAIWYGGWTVAAAVAALCTPIPRPERCCARCPACSCSLSFTGR